MAQPVKNLPAMQETWVQSLGGEDPLEESMATHSSILAWRIPIDRGAWEGYSPWGGKKFDTTDRLSLMTRYTSRTSTDTWYVSDNKIAWVGGQLAK